MKNQSNQWHHNKSSIATYNEKENYRFRQYLSAAGERVKFI